MHQWILKTSSVLFLTLLFVAPGFSHAQSNVNGNLNVTTDTTVERIKNNGGKTYLSSMNLSGSSIQSGGLDVTTTSTANTITADKDSQVSIASLLMNDSTVGSVSNPIKMEAHVQDVTAAQNARVDISSISMNGSTISGNLTVDDTIYTKAGNITVGENGSAAVASLLMNDSSANNVTIGKMSAVIDNLNVEDNATAHISSLEMTGVHAGDVTFSADTRLGGIVTASAGGNLNVNSVVMDGVNVSGPMNFDLSSDVKGGVEVSGEGSEVMVGGFRIALDNSKSTLPGPINENGNLIGSQFITPIDYARLSQCAYDNQSCLINKGWRRMEEKDLSDFGIGPDELRSQGDGFGATLYYNKELNQYILAFKGTNLKSIKDWWANFAQGGGLETAQYKRAIELAQKLSRAINGKGAELVFVGHSLGGGLASAASLSTGNKAITFNSAGLNPETVPSPKGNPEDLITAYQVAGDPLTRAQDSKLADLFATRIKEDPALMDYAFEIIKKEIGIGDGEVDLDLSFDDLPEAVGKKITIYPPVSKPDIRDYDFLNPSNITEETERYIKDRFSFIFKMHEISTVIGGLENIPQEIYAVNKF